MVSLFVSFIQIAWIKGPLCRQIKLCQGAYVVAGKILQKASGLPFPDCFLLPGQKKDFSTPRETSGMVTWSCQTAIAPSPSWAAQRFTYTRVVLRLCLARAGCSIASSPFFPFAASYSLRLTDQQSCSDTKWKTSCMRTFFVWLIMFPRKMSLTAELCNP